MTGISEKMLWWTYGFTYDGLRHFYPYQQLIRRTAELAEPRPGEAILELGCGTGNVLVELLRLQPAVKLTGVDLSSTMLTRARRKTRLAATPVDLSVGDIVSFLKQQPAACFDKIISVNVIYALGNRDTLWAEVARVLRPGGEIIIATATKTGSGDIIREHLDHAPWYRLLHPQLVGVSVVDAVIDRFGTHGKFPFPGESQLRQELAAVNFQMGPVQSCYGGVDILFKASPQS